MAIEFPKNKNFYVPGVETIFGEVAMRLNVTIERESIPTS